MRDIVKEYVENCVAMTKTSIKIHKKFSGYDNVFWLGYDNGFWLKDADKYIENASLAIKHDMLPSEFERLRPI